MKHGWEMGAEIRMHNKITKYLQTKMTKYIGQIDHEMEYQLKAIENSGVLTKIVILVFPAIKLQYRGEYA